MSDTTYEDDDDLLAAEYVLGVLEADARQMVSNRAVSNAGLAAAIARWERMLAPLALLVPPVEPPAELWRRLQQAIGSAAPVVDELAAAREVRTWRWATVASLALAAGLAFVAFLPRTAPPVAVAALAPLSGAAPAFVARVLPGGGLAIAALSPSHVPSNRDLELWALPAGAKKPISLGVLPAGGERIAASQYTAPGGKLLVSLEPKGGSPTGQPTGPVLYGGTITRL
jgi:anti-sigma-K factor RskA